MVINRYKEKPVFHILEGMITKDGGSVFLVSYFENVVFNIDFEFENDSILYDFSDLFFVILKFPGFSLGNIEGTPHTNVVTRIISVYFLMEFGYPKLQTAAFLQMSQFYSKGNTIILRKSMTMNCREGVFFYIMEVYFVTLNISLVLWLMDIFQKHKRKNLTFVTYLRVFHV